MSQPRIYLVGAGVIARAHAAAIARQPELQSAHLAVADPSREALEQFARLYPHAHLYESAEAMLREQARETDIVLVAAPPMAHAELACTALASGRHVLCEKPLALDEAQGRCMLATARAHNRLLGCCSSRFLGLAASLAARRLVQSSALGRLYHLRFIHRFNRSRPGIEYQPASRWFLDGSKSGGGILMDWAAYDFALMNDLLAPQQVDVLSAWMASPQTENPLPSGTVFDVEEHAGASLCYHLADGTRLAVSYERAACTHGQAQSTVELEGSAGAVTWNWLAWDGIGEVTHSFDLQGQLVQLTASYRDSLTLHDRPLVYFFRQVHGQPSPALLNEQVLFNFLCIRAIYACASSGQAQSVTLDELVPA